MKKLLISLFTLFICVDVFAEPPLPACFESSKQAIVDKVKEVAGPDLTQENLSKNPDKFFVSISEILAKACFNSTNIKQNPTIFDDFSQISMVKIPFQENSKYYELDITPKALLDYITIPTLILVTKADLKKKPGDIIAATEMPTDYFFNKDCSDHDIILNLSDDASVNVAGQASFPGFADQEFFIDFPYGKSVLSGGTRAFPGLIIRNDTKIEEDVDYVLWFKNFATGNQAAKDFAAALRDTHCSRDDLQVYVVTIDAKNPYLTNPANLNLGLLPPSWRPVHSLSVIINFPELAILQGNDAKIKGVYVLGGPYVIK